MKLVSKVLFLALLVGTILYSCTSEENELNINNQLEIENHPTPLEYISQYDNAAVTDIKIEFNFGEIFDKQIASTRSSCPAADHANIQYEWAAGLNDPNSCTYSDSYCEYLRIFWYAHLITAYANCDVDASCYSYNTAIGWIEGWTANFAGNDGHPFYVNNLYEQLAILEAAVANFGC